MASLSLLRTSMMVCAFIMASAMTSEDAVATQRLYEHEPHALQELFQQLLQEPDLDEDAEYQQFPQEQDFTEEGSEAGELYDDIASHDESAQDDEEVEKNEGTKRSEGTVPKTSVEESEDSADSRGDVAPDANEVVPSAVDPLGNNWVSDGDVDHFQSPWEFVTDLHNQGMPTKMVQEIVAGMLDSVKSDLEVQATGESGEMPGTVDGGNPALVVEESKMEMPHVGDVGEKNTVTYEGEPLFIRDAADASATSSSSQHTLLQMNEFSFNGNVLNGPKTAEDDVAHWIVQFCPHWWEPCEALTDAFAEVGNKLEQQLNNALMMTNIRFAVVDCASEKVLCNQQDVKTYPTTQHYYRGEYAAGWFGGQAQHAEFYTKWLMQQAEGITAQTPEGYVVGNLTTNDTAGGAWGSKEKDEKKEEMALPTFKEIAADIFLAVVLVALCTRFVLGNARLWQGRTPWLQQQQVQPLPPSSQSSQAHQLRETQPQESARNVACGKDCYRRGASRVPGTELYLPSSWNNTAKSMEL